MARVAAKEHLRLEKQCYKRASRSNNVNRRRIIGGGGQQLSIPLGSDTIITPAARLFLGPALLRQATVKDAVVP